jgi:hypothetical protein
VPAWRRVPEASTGRPIAERRATEGAAMRMATVIEARGVPRRRGRDRGWEAVPDQEVESWWSRAQ